MFIPANDFPAEPHGLGLDAEGPQEVSHLPGFEHLPSWARCPGRLLEVEQRHQERPVGEVFSFLEGLGFTGHVLDEERLRPLSEFEVQRDQVAFLRPNALFSAPAPGYLFEFLFTPA